MADNLRFYKQGADVPSEAIKPITAGRLKGFSDINPMWRIKRLTEMFGPCGIGWWYQITDKRLVPDEATQQVAAFMDILLFYKDPETGEVSQGIPGTGGSSYVAKEQKGLYLSDECFKMALTDAISVAAKALGIGASVYFSKDRTKYNAGENSSGENNSGNDNPEALCECCGNVIKPYPDSKGSMVRVDKHIAGSLERFGKQLCIDCIKNGMGAQE